MNKKAIKHLKSDPVMAGVIDKVGPLDFVPRMLPPFHSLVHSIIHQQLSGKAADTILKRFVALFGGEDFPSPEAVAAMDPNTLRAAGLSLPKAGYVKDVARRALDGLIPSLEECRLLSDNELIERLTAIKGVGQWTVEMLLIFNFGRPDVLPIGDLGVRRGYQIAYRKRSMPTEKQLQTHGKKWIPYRTTAALYLWKTVDFLKG